MDNEKKGMREKRKRIQGRIGPSVEKESILMKREKYLARHRNGNSGRLEKERVGM